MVRTYPLAEQSVELYQPIPIGSTYCLTVGRLVKTSDDSGIIGHQILGISSLTKRSERVYINQTAEPTLVLDRSAQNQENIYRYDFLKCGIDSDNTVVPPTTLATDETTVYHEKDDEVACVVSPELLSSIYEVVTENATEIEVIYGETIGAFIPVMVNTANSKIEIWDGTFELQGITKESGVLDDEKTISLLGAKIVNPTGIVAGALYAKKTGVLTNTSSTDTQFIGMVVQDSSGDLVANTGYTPTSSLEKASQSEAETGTDDEKYMTSLKTKQAQGMLGEVRSFAVTIANALSVSDLQALGWAVCNGTTPASQSVSDPTITANTPNLVDKFIRGDASASGGTGGQDTVTLTEAQMPSHKHEQKISSGSSGTPYSLQSDTSADIPNTSPLCRVTTIAAQGGTLALGGGTEGADAPHENKPPYYELVFMIKVR